MSEIRVDSITDEVGTGSPAFTNGLAQSDIAGALNATGTAPIYACRAWVNFSGFSNTIRDSGNVSSVTFNGGGDYQVNFSSALIDGNYATNISTWYGTAGGLTELVVPCGIKRGQAPSTTSVRVQVTTSVFTNSGTGTDVDGIFVSVFR